MRIKFKVAFLPSFLLLLFQISIGAQQPAPTATPVQPAAAGGKSVEPTFRMIRAVAGTRVVDNAGKVFIEDPRTAFYVPADSQIVVLFTWEGPAGPHHFEGLWKNPAGKVSMTSEFDYAPDQPRFSAYFRMLLAENPPAGIWTLEVRIDSETAGAHNFQIIAAPRPDNVVTISRVLPPAEIYKRALAATVFIENINAKGDRRSVGSGFLLTKDRVVTAFEVIDGATKLRMITPTGQRLDAQEVIAWNRRQDWAILRISSEQTSMLSPAGPNSWAVGDRSYVLDVPSEGSRALIETSIIGKQNLLGGGDRINIGDAVSRRALGSPLLNDRAEVIGIVGGSPIPGSAFFDDQVLFVRNLGGVSRGTLAVPIEFAKESISNSSPTTIESLASSGQFTPPLVGNDDVLSGTLSRNLNRKIDPPQAIDARTDFSRRDTRAIVLITWLPKQKRKGIPALKLYDLDNRLLNQSTGKKKISVNPQKLSYTSWELSLAELAPGTYRLDVLLDADPVWRTYFRIIE